MQTLASSPWQRMQLYAATRGAFITDLRGREKVPIITYKGKTIKKIRIIDGKELNSYSVSMWGIQKTIKSVD